MQDCNIKIGVAIQGRLGSTRLPNKILLPSYDGEPLIVSLTKKLTILTNFRVIVATTRNVNDDRLVKVLEDNRIEYYRGDENNVLSRFIETAYHFNLTHIIRVCSDNPFIDVDLLHRMCAILAQDSSLDYISFSYKNRPVILSHFGIFCELVSLKGLKKIAELSGNRPEYYEHVTMGFYSEPGEFKLNMPDVTTDFQHFEGVRLTIDTAEDYYNYLALKEKLGININTPTIELLSRISTNTGLIDKMGTIITKNQK